MHSSAVERRIADPEVAGSIPVAPFPSRLAQLVERKTLNLVVVGSSPTVGMQEPMAQRQRVGFQTRRLGVQIPLGSLFFLRSAFLPSTEAVSPIKAAPLAVPLYAILLRL